MSFTYGSVAVGTFAGVTATLVSWPSLGGLQIESIETPGSDGEIFAAATLGRARFVFDVILSGKSPAEVFELRDRVVAALDPKLGERPLLMDAAPGWFWPAVCSTPVDWERLTWDRDLGFKLRHDVAFDALGGVGRLTADESWSRTGAGSITVKPVKGNTVSFPKIEITGTLSAAQSVTVTVGAWKCTVTGPLAAGQVLRLDFDRFDFAVWNGTTKVANVVHRMSTLDRLEFWPGTSYTVAVATTGSISKVDVAAQSRRQ